MKDSADSHGASRREPKAKRDARAELAKLTGKTPEEAWWPNSRADWEHLDITVQRLAVAIRKIPIEQRSTS